MSERCPSCGGSGVAYTSALDLMAPVQPCSACRPDDHRWFWWLATWARIGLSCWRVARVHAGTLRRRDVLPEVWRLARR